MNNIHAGWISEALKDMPLTTVEISKIIKNKYGYDLGSFQVRNIIREVMDNETEYNSDTNKYKLIDINNTDPTKELDNSVPVLFINLDKLFSRRQEIFATTSAEDRETYYKEELIKINSEIENSIRLASKEYQESNYQTKENIRSKISSAFKNKLAQLITSKNKSKTEERVLDNKTKSFDTQIIFPKHFHNKPLLDSLLFNLIYSDFPKTEDIEENMDKYFEPIKVFNDEFRITNKENLHGLRVAIDTGTFLTKEKALFNWLIYEYKKDNNSLNFSHQFETIQKHLKNPFKFFFKLLDYKVENISFKNESPKFHEILTEVCRDNKVTDSEEIYLYKKAEEYFIDKEKLKIFLDNQFMAYGSFKVFIDEVCEDGILTEEEEEYVLEKATQYNVPHSTVFKMIKIGLTRAKLIDDIVSMKNLYPIILTYLFSNAFKIEKVNNLMFQIFHGERFDFNENDSLDEVSDILFNSLKQNLVKTDNYFSRFHNIYDLLFSLDLEVIDHKDALTDYKDNSKVEDTVEGQELENIYIDKDYIEINQLDKLFQEEKRRIGSPDVEHFIENIKFRINHNL